MDKVITFLRSNAVYVYSVVVAGLALAVSFGLSITGEQKGALIAFVAVVLGLSIPAQAVEKSNTETALWTEPPVAELDEWTGE